MNNDIVRSYSFDDFDDFFDIENDEIELKEVKNIDTKIEIINNKNNDKKMESVQIMSNSEIDEWYFSQEMNKENEIIKRFDVQETTMVNENRKSLQNLSIEIPQQQIIPISTFMNYEIMDYSMITHYLRQSIDFIYQSPQYRYFQSIMLLRNKPRMVFYLPYEKIYAFNNIHNYSFYMNETSKTISFNEFQELEERLRDGILIIVYTKVNNEFIYSYKAVEFIHHFS
jgi:hypothetical protein